MIIKLNNQRLVYNYHLLKSVGVFVFQKNLFHIPLFKKCIILKLFSKFNNLDQASMNLADEQNSASRRSTRIRIKRKNAKPQDENATEDIWMRTRHIN